MAHRMPGVHDWRLETMELEIEDGPLLRLDASEAATPSASVAVMQRFGRFRARSGHAAHIVDRSKMPKEDVTLLSLTEYGSVP
jgi:hypothetical protein